MSEFFKAELKDKFLEYASERDEYFQMQLLYDEFLRPNYSLEYVERLILEIIEYNPDLLDIMSGNGAKIFMLSSTGLTLEFLEEGGFKDIYVTEEEKWDTFLEQLSNGKRLSSEEKANLGKTEKPVHKKERRLLLLLISAVSISFLFTLYSILRGVFFEEDYITKEELQQAIEAMAPKKDAADSFLSIKNDSIGLTGLQNDSAQDSTRLESSMSMGQKP